MTLMAEQICAKGASIVLIWCSERMGSLVCKNYAEQLTVVQQHIVLENIRAKQLGSIA